MTKTADAVSLPQQNRKIKATYLSFLIALLAAAGLVFFATAEEKTAYEPIHIETYSMQAIPR